MKTLKHLGVFYLSYDMKFIYLNRNLLNKWRLQHSDSASLLPLFFFAGTELGGAQLVGQAAAHAPSF